MTAPPRLDPGARANEVAQRLDRLRELLDRSGADAFALAARRNVAWATLGGETHIVLAQETGVATLVVSRGVAALVTANIEAARIADEEVPGLPIEVRDVPWWDAGAMEAAIAEAAGGQRILRDGDVEDALRPLRSVLGEVEQERMRWLGRRVREAIDGALDALEPGMTEDDAAAAALRSLAVAGVRAPVVLAAADERLPAYRHPLPVGRRVERRLMLVLVGERWGLHVALTRIRDLQQPPSEVARRQALAERILARMRDASRPGASLGDVLGEAQAAYAEAGFPEEWRLHHQGGTIAYQGREVVATPGDGTRIEPGMAFAWNPSITGAKAEETFLLGTDGNAEVVTG